LDRIARIPAADVEVLGRWRHGPLPSPYLSSRTK
jgi:hypothetical protein